MAPRHHQLSPICSTALSSAGDSAAAAAELLAAEHSRRLLLLRILLERGAPVADAAGRLPAAEAAWRLLARAQRAAPDRVRQVVLDPQTGIWVADTLRSLTARTPVSQKPATGEKASFWTEFGGLHRLAAAAAALAGLEFRIDVPVEHGTVLLPGLGRADVPHGETAEVRGGPAGLTVGAVHVPRPAGTEAPGWAADAPGWAAVRRVRAECDGRVLDVALDDLGRGPAGGGAGTRLSAAEYEGWRRRTERAWTLLVREHPDSAAALAAGVLSLVPLPCGERLRPHSASFSDAFGCVVLSAPHPDDEPGAATELALTLIHEYRHSALNGLMRLAALHDGTDDGLYHAPWRDDPRPLVGLLHGAYAFAGVTAFWRVRRTADTGSAALLAHFEFALWRRQTWSVLRTLAGRPALTAAGRHLVAGLQAAVAPWLEEPVPEPAARLAGLAAAHHRGAWRAHHVRPDKEAVRATVAALAAGDDLSAALTVPGPAGSDAEDTEYGVGVVEPDPEGCRLDVVALLARLRIVDPEAFGRLREGAGRLPGSTPADLALTAGDPVRAEALYAAELERPAAWAGLALALRESGRAGSVPALPRLLELLELRPEFVRAVAEARPAGIAPAQLIGR